MSNYQLVPEPEAYLAVSGLGAYVAQPEPEAYVAVSGLGAYVQEDRPAAYVAVSDLGEETVVAPPEEKTGQMYVPGTTVVREKESMTGMWLLLALAGGCAGYMFWRMRQAGLPIFPAKAPTAGLDELGHSGRTYYGVFPKHRGYGHHRLATGRWHFHKR
jgi:hypothetical protein